MPGYKVKMFIIVLQICLNCNVDFSKETTAEILWLAYMVNVVFSQAENSDSSSPHGVLESGSAVLLLC